MTRLTETRELINAIYAATARLEELHPGRRFTPDGILVGSFGEVLAEDEFGITLNPNSTKGHDGIAADGRKVEVKMTGHKTFALKYDTDHLIAYARSASGEIELVYNGPLSPVWNVSQKPNGNKQRKVSLNRVRALNAMVAEPDRLVPVA